MHTSLLTSNGGHSKLVFCYLFVDVEEGTLMFLLRTGSAKPIDTGAPWRKRLCLFSNLCSWRSRWIVWWMSLAAWLEVRSRLPVIVSYTFRFRNTCLNSSVSLESRNTWLFFAYLLFRKKGILRKFLINCQRWLSSWK